MTTNHISSLHIRSVPVLDQDEALDFYTNLLGFEARDDIDMGFMRWLTVGVPGQDTSLLLELVGGPQHDESTASQVRELVTKGALGGLFLLSTDVHATYAALRDAGVEITQEPVEQPYGTDFGIRDPFGNHVRISQPNTASPTEVQEAYESADASWSYPPPLYDGESGEVSAHVVRTGTEPAIVYPNGNKVFHLALGTGTQGTFGLYRWEFAGPRSGPDAHFHRTITESFYVLEGIVTIFDGTNWVKCHAGDFAHVPAGGIHGFRNEDGAATMLLHFAPGAPREAYFEGLAAGMGNLDGDAYDRFMAEHDNHWV